MNVEQAMIIKTNSSEQTALAQQFREEMRSIGQDVVLVPYSVNALLITKVDEQLVVISKHYVPVTEEVMVLDVAKGFTTEDECWWYARLVVREAKLQEHIINIDIPEELVEEGIQPGQSFQVEK